jgi:hypothetical protein
MTLRADQSIRDQTDEEWVGAFSGSPVTRIKPTIRESHGARAKPKGEKKLSFTGIVEGHAWVPEGKYWVRYLKDEIEQFPKYGYKLVVYFSIREGDHTGQIIRAFYKLEESRRGLVMREGSRWVEEMRELFPSLANNACDPLKKPDPLPVSLIHNKTILAEIEDSGKGKKKKKHHARPFSVVRRLLKVKDTCVF